MMEAVLRVIVTVVCLAAVVYWIVCLTRWDGQKNCDMSQCNSCPFPCKERDKEREKK